MAEHYLNSTVETVHWGHLDASLPAVLTVESGDVVVIDALSGSLSDIGGDISIARKEHREVIEKVPKIMGPHILTGPVEVRGAEPGDVLEVRILGAEVTEDWGYNLMHVARGTLPAEFPFERQRTISIDRGRQVAVLPWVEIPLAPFFGIVAVAPRPELGRVSSVPPGEFGGNLDLKEMRPGSSMFLPVFVPGAKFSAGDGHAVQGDGEMDLTGLEVCMKGTFQLVLHKGRKLDFPRAVTPTHYIALGVDEDLDVAVQKASHNMVDWLVELTGWTREEAYVFGTFGCDMRVTQFVNVRKGVHVMVSRELLEANSKCEMGKAK